MIDDIEDFFARGCGRCDRFAIPDCATRRWAGGLRDLRAICRSAALVETVKWGHPCYVFANRNIAIIGALRNDFRLSFFEAGLVKDPDGLLERQGPNTEHPDMLRFTSDPQPSERSAAIEAYLQEAKGYAERGLKAAKAADDPYLPDELLEALDADPGLAEAFWALTRGRRKSYVIHLNAAMLSETRAKRIAGFRKRIIAGKGATER